MPRQKGRPTRIADYLGGCSSQSASNCDLEAYQWESNGNRWHRYSALWSR
jgi:hypothetical protein